MARIKEQLAHQQRAARPVELLSPYWGGTRPRAYTHAFPGTPASVPAARHHARATLRGCGAPAELCDLAELVMSELVTNAVLRTGSSVVRCTIRMSAYGVRVEVGDDGPAQDPPVMGHEMFLVDRVAQAWGTTPDTDCEGRAGSHGRTVWADLAVPDRPSGESQW